MAEQNARTERGNEARGIIGAIADALFRPFELLGAAIGIVMGAVMADGTLAAAGRQGIDEIGVALKAFPDTIQVFETGTIWNPTPGEVGNNRDLPGYGRRHSSSGSGEPPHPWPSEMAQHNRQAGNDHAHDNSQDAGQSM